MRRVFAALGLVAVLLAALGSVAHAWYWQPHYYGPHIWDGIDLDYWWTDRWGRPLEVDEHGETITHQIHLDWCYRGYGVLAPLGAGDVDFEFSVVTKTRCAKATALKQVDGLWQTDLGGFFAGTGEPQIYWPSMFTNETMDVYWGVDVAAYYNAGGTEYAPEQEFHIVNGACADLPGFVFGTSPVYLDTSVGLVTDNPIADALVTTEGEEGVCPEPSCVLTLICGLATVAGAIRARRRA